jgi:hypothetical protein
MWRRDDNLGKHFASLILAVDNGLYTTNCSRFQLSFNLISGTQPSCNKIDFVSNQNYGKNLMVKTSIS